LPRRPTTTVSLLEYHTLVRPRPLDGNQIRWLLSSSIEARQRRARHGRYRRSKRSSRIRNQGRGHGTECRAAVSRHAGNSSTPGNSTNVADSSNASARRIRSGNQRTTTLVRGAPRLPNNPYLCQRGLAAADFWTKEVVHQSPREVLANCTTRTLFVGDDVNDHNLLLKGRPSMTRFSSY